MARPSLPTSPSDPLPQVAEARRPLASSVDPGVSAPTPLRSPAPPASSRSTPGARPSLPSSGAASSPAVAASRSSTSTSAGEDAGGSAVTTSSTVDVSTAQTSSSSFPALDSLKDALPAENALPPQSASGASRPATGVAGVDHADNHAVAAHAAYVSEQAGYPGATMQAWPSPGPSALGMSMGGVPLVPLVNGVALDGGSGGNRRRTGSCKFFNAQKGFGFILDDSAQELGDDEVFVHYTAIAAVQGGPRGFRSLLEGEAVEYTIVQGPKGWQAQDVTGPNGAPCIGTPPGGIPKTGPYPAGAPPARMGGPYPKTGLRRSSIGSSAFTSPMRSARGESSLYGSSLASPADTNRTSLPSPSSRTLRVQTSGSVPSYPGGLSPSPQTYQPVHMYPFPPPQQQQHYPYPFSPEDGPPPHLAGGPPFYGSPDDAASPLSPIDPRYGAPFGSFGGVPPGMDPSAPPPFYPISSSAPQGNSFPHSPSSYPGPPPPFPGAQGAYPISSSPAAAPYLHLYPPTSQFPPYGGFVPAPPSQGMYYDPSSAPPPPPQAFVPAPYPITASGEAGEDGAYTAGGPAPTGAQGAPSGLAAGWAEAEPAPPTEAGAGAQDLPSTSASSVKLPAPLPSGARGTAGQAS
ncbi:hypothetical protein JCM10450v2_001766 [Rhodotorula kratochvilovae]